MSCRTRQRTGLRKRWLIWEFNSDRNHGRQHYGTGGKTRCVDTRLLIWIKGELSRNPHRPPVTSSSNLYAPVTLGQGFAVDREWPKCKYALPLRETMGWAEIKLESPSVDAFPQSLVYRPLTFSDSFLIRSPYCCKQLSLLSILSASGSDSSNQSQLSILTPPPLPD